VAQGVGPEFKLEYLKNKKGGRRSGPGGCKVVVPGTLYLEQGS
jgi:hypothetical protein